MYLRGPRSQIDIEFNYLCIGKSVHIGVAAGRKKLENISKWR